MSAPWGRPPAKRCTPANLPDSTTCNSGMDIWAKWTFTSADPCAPDTCLRSMIGGPA